MAIGIAAEYTDGTRRRSIEAYSIATTATDARQHAQSLAAAIDDYTNGGLVGWRTTEVLKGTVPTGQTVDPRSEVEEKCRFLFRTADGSTVRFDIPTVRRDVFEAGSDTATQAFRNAVSTVVNAGFFSNIHDDLVTTFVRATREFRKRRR